MRRIPGLRQLQRARLDLVGELALDTITRIMAELALDDGQRDALMRHLDRVRVAKVVRGEPSTDAGKSGGSSKLLAGG